MIGRLLRRFIRSWAFVSKEISEVRRQPRLILSLILGPFLILFLFGAGYQGDHSKLSALVVVPKNSGYSTNIEDYRKLTGGQFDVAGVTTDEAAAVDRLKHGDVNLVVVVPQKISEQISGGSQVAVPFYYDQIDPLRRDAIAYSTYLFVNEINKQTVAEAASRGQQNAGDIRSGIATMRRTLDSMDASVQKNQTQQASQQAQQLQGYSSNMQLGLAVLSQLASSRSTLIKPSQPQDPGTVNLAKSQEAATKLQVDLGLLSNELSKPNPDKATVHQRIGTVRQDLDTLDKMTQQFQSINPLVLAAPFYAYPQNKAPIETSFTRFYAPAVLALLLQHIGVTLASLSMVRERLLGTVELFRVSPSSPAEILIGKYVGFGILLAVIAGVLLLLMSNNLDVAGVPLSLGVPILGDWAALVLTLAFLVFASVGLGFFISAISRTESQAVQLSMLVLLGSVFFGGFFLRIDTLWPGVRAVSYALPVTYGIGGLQDIMLRGDTPSPALLLSLLFLGAFFGLLGYVLFRRQMKRGF